MFWNLWLTEELKLYRRPLVWICFLLLTGILFSDVLGQYLAADHTQSGSSTSIMIDGQAPERPAPSASQHTPQRSTWPTAFVHSLELLRQYSWLIVIVIVGGTTAQEYLWRVPHFLLSRGVPRLTYLGSRFAAFLLPVLGTVLLPLLSSAFLSAFCTQALLGVLDIHSVNFTQLVVSVLATGYSLLPYTSLALLLAIVGRSFILPIGGGIAFVVIENLAYESGISLARYLPYTLGAGVARLYERIPATALPDSSAAQRVVPLEVLGIGPSLFGVLIWSGLLLGLAVIIFLKKDLPE